MKGGQYMPPAMRKIYTEESEVELLEMTRDEVTEGMNDKEVLFCEASDKIELTQNNSLLT
jgi:hypothetical protein